MPLHIIIAERVYQKISDKKLLSDRLMDRLNDLIHIIRDEIKNTPFKLKYNFIDFEECLSKPMQDCVVKLDLSLIPAYKNKDEYILWLASFIEKITTGGKPTLPPIRNFIPLGFKFYDNSGVIITCEPNSEIENLITNYFKSKDFKRIIKNKKHYL
ncbi:hypothetical protein I5515_04755 [Acinetobacter calcoaceticus]|uniref:hypothetical protein n=1 Tax=Acinetobacter calcoaceticus TaxID=471 RepID=UPI0018FFAB2C|nr:hypothetical protein [Acinetobacter calcoaceticus]MBJ9721104.1 hypothetical protein [Acinetobacter calcoaceticus]